MSARHYHPLAAVRIFRKKLWLLLAPLLQSVLVWQPEALLHLLYQEMAVLLLIACYTFCAWRASGWQLQTGAHPTLCINRGVLLHQTLQTSTARLAFVGLERPPWLRILGASRLVLCYKTAALPHRHAPRQLRLLLTKTDAETLANALLCPNAHSNADTKKFD